MSKITLVILQSLFLIAAAYAGSITISVSNPTFIGTNGGNACVTPYLGSQNCAGGVNSNSNSSITPSGSAQSSWSAELPTPPPANGVAPAMVQGQLVGPYAGAESSTTFDAEFQSGFNTLSFFPTISINFDPEGADGSAQVTVTENNTDFQSYSATLTLTVLLSGSSAGSFTFDAATAVMNLQAPAGGIGSFGVGWTAGYCLGDPCNPRAFPFHASGTVSGTTVQNNVTGYSQIFPPVSVPGFGQVFNGVFQGTTTDTISQQASLITPEPGTFSLISVAFGSLLLVCGRRRKRYTQTNAALSGTGLPSAAAARD
jgi:hypothetical protein